MKIFKNIKKLFIDNKRIYNESRKERDDSMQNKIKSPYNALDVAKYIINFSNEKDYLIDNLKLQKLLYYCQVHFLCDYREHTKCFTNKILAWDWGPVVPEVYKEYKSNGSNLIPHIRDKEFDVHEVINNDDIKKIEYVVDTFKNYNAIAMMKKTHQEEPWINAYNNYLNNEITDEAIRSYYINVEEK